MATSPQSSDNFLKDLTIRQDNLATIRPGMGNTGMNVAYIEPITTAANGPAEDGGGLPALWQLLRGRRKLIAWLAAAGAVVGLGLSQVLTPVYEAKSTLEFQSTRSTDPVSGIENDSGGLTPESYLQTQVRVLKSRTLLKRVETALQGKFGGTEAAPGVLTRAIGMMTARASAAPAKPAAPAKLPAVETQVKLLDNSRIIEITADSPSPAYAAAFANGLAQNYIDYNVETTWQSAQSTSDWLTRQLQGLRTRLEDSESRLQAYTEQTGLIYTGNDESVDDDRLKALERSLADAQADRINKQSAYEIASTSPADSLPQVLDNGRLSDYQSKLADLRRQYAEASAIYTPAHYKVRELQAQINDMQATLQRERTNIVSRIQSDYEGASKREKMLQGAYAAQLARVSDQSRKAIQYGILKREVDTNRQVYEQLLQKAKQVGIGAAMQPNNIRIVDNAEIPRHPARPDPLRYTVLGLASGLVFAVGFVVSSEFINRSVRAPGEAPFHLRVPELGVIPSRASVADEPLMPSILPGRSSEPAAKPKLELVTWQDRPSLLAEAYRNALASILTAHGKGRPKVILITSSGHSEGKSTTVSNLGIALAEINQRVLLVDADLRKPRLHDIFNLPNTWGLTDLLREKSSLSDCPLEALARRSEVDNLYVLPSGPGTVSITNLLYSARMAALVERVRREFDITIIDTPPMNYLADARVLGQLADAAILVIRASRTTRDDARQAKQRLVDDGIRVLGTILNGWEPKNKTRYGYTYGYGYGYGNTHPRA